MMDDNPYRWAVDYGDGIELYRDEASANEAFECAVRAFREELKDGCYDGSCVTMERLLPHKSADIVDGSVVVSEAP